MPVISENWKMRPKHNLYSKLIRKYYKIRVNMIKPHSPIPDKYILEDNLLLDEYLQKLFKLKGNGHPKIYYNPNLIEQLKGKTIVDPFFGPTRKANGYYEKDFHATERSFLR